MAEEADVEIKFGASLEGLTAGLNEAKEKLEELLAPIGDVREALSGIGEVVAFAFAAEKVEEFIKSMGELGEHTERTARILGLSSEEVGRLQYAFAASGTPIENLDQMVTRFEVGLVEAQKGTGRMAAGLAAIGLNAKELIGIHFPEQLEKISEAVSHFDKNSANLPVAVGAIGRGFVELLPMLEEGKEHLEELNKTADRTNSVLSTEMTEKLAEMQHGFVELGHAIRGVSIEAFEPFIPVVNGAVKILTNLAEGFSQSIKEGGLIKLVLEAIATQFKLVEQVVSTVIATIKNFGAAGVTAFDIVVISISGFAQYTKDVFEALGRALPAFFVALATAGAEAFRLIAKEAGNAGTVLEDFLMARPADAIAAAKAMGAGVEESLGKIKGAFATTFDFSAADATMKSTGEKLAAAINEGNKKLVENAKVAKAEYDTIWGEQHESFGPPMPPGKQAPNLDVKTGAGKDEAFKLAEAQAEAEIQAAQRAAKGTTDTLNEELKVHAITMASWVQQTDAALEKESAAVKAAYDKELETAGLTSAQIIQIKNKEAQALGKIAEQEKQASNKAAEQAAQEWTKFQSTITGAFNSQIHGLLAGTQTFSEAFRNMTAQLAEHFITFAADLAINWLLQLSGMKAATAAFNALIAPMMTSGEVTAAATQKAGAAEAITTDIGQAYAGFAAFLAPELGPAAPEAAAALAGQVGTTAATLSSLAVGGMIMSDGLISAHAGEKITPARVATPYGSGSGGGGDADSGGGDLHLHFEGGIVGTQQWIDSMVPQIARATNKHMAINPSSRPRW